jgi:pyruvyltransferase
VLRLKCYEEVPNVGDQFGRALAAHHFGRAITTSGEVPLDEVNLVLLGSILQWADQHSVVCGPGLLSADLRPTARPALITCVRGPLTARALRGHGIACPDLFGDPGILAAELFPPSPGPTIALAVVPHYVDLDSPWVDLCRTFDVPILDVRGPLDAFFDQLQHCEVVLSSSLHGIIFAHAYGRRALWIELSNLVNGDGFKFFDYYASIGVPAKHVDRLRVPPLTDPRELASMATSGQQAHLVPGLRRALGDAAEFLEGCA